MKWLLAVTLIPALGGMAAADDLADEFLEAPEIGPAPGLAARLSDGLSELSNELGLHLATLSADMINMHVDVRQRSARLRLGGGKSERFLLRLDGDMEFARGGTRVKAKLDISLVGHHLSIPLPDFDVVPRSMEGKRYLELRLPLIEGQF